MPRTAAARAGRTMAKWTKNHMLEIGAIVGAVGLILTVLSFTFAYGTTGTQCSPGSVPPSWLTSYGKLVCQDYGNLNLIIFVAGPIMLLIGGFYFGEQFVLRRRFERTIDTPKKSEFAARRRDLEDLAKRLPDSYGDRIEAKESEFKSKRTA